MLPGNDRATLEAFRRGEAAVLTQVYRTYSPEVVRYLSRRFLVRTEASTRPVSLTPLDLESAHQETFVRAFRPPMRMAYDGVRPYLGFLLTIANSTAIDLMRASGRVSRESISMDEAPGLQQLPGEALNPEEQAMETRGAGSGAPLPGGPARSRSATWPGCASWRGCPRSPPPSASR